MIDNTSERLKHGVIKQAIPDLDGIKFYDLFGNLPQIEDDKNYAYERGRNMRRFFQSLNDGEKETDEHEYAEPYA